MVGCIGSKNQGHWNFVGKKFFLFGLNLGPWVVGSVNHPTCTSWNLVFSGCFRLEIFFRYEHLAGGERVACNPQLLLRPPARVGREATRREPAGPQPSPTHQQQLHLNNNNNNNDNNNKYGKQKNNNTDYKINSTTHRLTPSSQLSLESPLLLPCSQWRLPIFS